MLRGPLRLKSTGRYSQQWEKAASLLTQYLPNRSPLQSAEYHRCRPCCLQRRPRLLLSRPPSKFERAIRTAARPDRIVSVMLASREQWFVTALRAASLPTLAEPAYLPRLSCQPALAAPLHVVSVVQQYSETLIR